ncbi:hypothetical protein PF339_002085 [Salmonella enterica]|nr:hypothetical protein [Salmonella enterica]EBB6669044.1 hypothetical protein [Salmonella enterica]EBB6983921.1 hypothetical protein [Salmonella enterica]EBB9332102.1 hypothetical protein [Salmonella enterica]EBC0974593.1 hypothetical protein [Salmonella enterica]EBC2148099.1 hypothetical protein [Salmonella enterica]
MKRLVFAVLTLTCFSASAKDKPLDGKESMTHDYNCMGVSTGRSAVMTVQEFPEELTKSSLQKMRKSQWQ